MPIMQQNPYAAPSADPNAAPRTGTMGERPEDWTIGGVLSAGWNGFKSQPGTMLGGFLLLVICLYGVLAAMVFAMMPMQKLTLAQLQDPMSFMAYIWLIILLIVPLEAYLFTGWIRLCLAVLRRESASLGLLFSGGRRLLPVLLGMIVTNLLVTIAFLFLIVPGFVVALGTIMVMPLLADTELGVGEALSRSWDQMKGHKLHVFGLTLVVLVIWLVGSLLTFNLGALLMAPIFSLVGCEVYVCITGRRSPDPAA